MATNGFGSGIGDGYVLYNINQEPESSNGIDEVICVMREILEELKEVNSKLDSIQGDGLWNSISDVYDKMSDIETIVSSL